MNKEPETYSEMLKQKLCYDLRKYINISQEYLKLVYDYLSDNKEDDVLISRKNVILRHNGIAVRTLPITIKDETVASIMIVNKCMYVDYIRQKSSGFSDGGGSSNNNNNNNNNNN